MQIIHHLGYILSENIGISAAASRGLIKLAIKDELGPFIPLNLLKLPDYQKVISNTLKRRLVAIKVSNPDSIIDLLKIELIENQSLITIEKV